MAPPSVLTFEELSGKSRKIELAGPGLPLRGAAWPTEQRLVTTWYQGSSEATQQVLGGTDQESSWNGVWNTTRLLRSPCRFFESADAAPVQVADAFTLYRLFDSVRLEGRELRVSWSAGEGIGGGGDRTIVRVGRIRQFVPAFDRGDDVRWTLDLAWTGRGGSKPDASVSRAEDVAATMAALSAAMADLAGSIESARIRSERRVVPLSASEFSLGDLERLADAPEELVASIARTARQIETRADRAGALAEKVRGTPDAIRDKVAGEASNARSAMTRLARGAGVLPVEILAPDDGRVAGQVRAASYVYGAGGGAEDAAARAASIEAAAKRKRSALADEDRRGGRGGASDFRASHVARKGDTFASLSLRYFGSAERAGDIARANGLPAYQVAPDPGASLVIPSAPVGSGSSA